MSEELWLRRSREWEAELAAIRAETAKVENVSHDYAVTGSKILELARTAHLLFTQQDPAEQAKLLKTLLSNCTFDRGTLWDQSVVPPQSKTKKHLRKTTISMLIK